jgi:hypothetical protein
MNAMNHEAEDGDVAEESRTVAGDQTANQPGEHTRDDQYADVEFTLYLRPASSSALERCQRRIQQRFLTFDQLWDGDAAPVERWYKRVSEPTENPEEQRIIDLFDEFNAVVDEAGGRLTPFFEQREQESLLGFSSTGRTIVFPVACLTVRQGDSLVGLYPCWIDGEHYSVGDCLDRLEDGEGVRNLP